MRVFYRSFLPGIVVVAALTGVTSCNEAKRGTDTNVNETKSEAAAEENADKFSGDAKQDASFVYDVVSSNYSEIQFAELASQRSRLAEVNDIAEMLITEHTAALTELKNIAQAKAIAVPVEAQDESERDLENLAEESDKDFNEEWVEKMISLHEKDIEKFEDRLEETDDPDLKAYIEKNLPHLKEHHERLKGLEERLRQQEKR